MARTALAVQEISRAGLNPVYSAANVDGHSIANGDARTYLHVKNGSGAPITVTAQTYATYDGLALADLVVSVPAGGERLIGPFPRALYNQMSDVVYVDFSGVTSLTVGAFHIAQAS